MSPTCIHVYAKMTNIKILPIAVAVIAILGMPDETLFHCDCTFLASTSLKITIFSHLVLPVSPPSLTGRAVTGQARVA